MEKYQIVGLLINLFLLGFIIHYIRKGKLKEKYSLLWIFSSLTFIIFSIWLEPINYFKELFGIANPVNLILMLAGSYMLFIILHFTFALSKSHDDYKKIAQRLALLENKFSKHTDSED